MQTFDLVVVGGGPSGSLLSTLIAQQGYKVLLLDKSRFPVYKIGESLLPSIHTILSMVGLSKEDFDQTYVSKAGGSFRWGQEKDLFSFYFGQCSRKKEGTPHITTAYQVRRTEFDHTLLKNAQKKGVDVREGCSVQELLKDDTGRVNGVTYKNPDGLTLKVAARYVADASGHNSRLNRQAGDRIFAKLYQNVAMYSYFENGQRLEGKASGNVLFEAFDDGWMWYIPIGKNTTSVGALINKDRIKKEGNNLRQVYENYLQKTTTIKELLQSARPAQSAPYDKVYTRSDYSYCHSHFWAPGLVLLGDAAAFIDVLLSSGVHLATYGALLCARSLSTYFSGKLDEATCFNEFELRYKKEFCLFYHTLAGLYDQRKDSITYRKWLRHWLTQTNSCSLEPLVDLEKQVKFMRSLSGLPTDNSENINIMRNYINQLLSNDLLKYDIENKAELPKYITQLTPTKNKLSWEKVL